MQGILFGMSVVDFIIILKSTRNSKCVAAKECVDVCVLVCFCVQINGIDNGILCVHRSGVILNYYYVVNVCHPIIIIAQGTHTHTRTITMSGRHQVWFEVDFN